MPAVMQPSNVAKFGISGTGTDLFQSRSTSTKMDEKEATNHQGETVGWAFFGKMAEHSIEMLGTGVASYSLGVASSAPTGITAAVGGTVFCVDEVSVELVNDNFVTGSVKVSEYAIED